MCVCVCAGGGARFSQYMSSKYRWWSREKPKMTMEWRTSIKYTVPSILYLLCNNLALEALRYLKPSTYQVAPAAMQQLRNGWYGFRAGDRSRGSFATPADLSCQHCSPYGGLRVRCECL